MQREENNKSDTTIPSSPSTQSASSTDPGLTATEQFKNLAGTSTRSPGMARTENISAAPNPHGTGTSSSSTNSGGVHASANPGYGMNTPSSSSTDASNNAKDPILRNNSMKSGGMDTFIEDEDSKNDANSEEVNVSDDKKKETSDSGVKVTFDGESSEKSCGSDLELIDPKTKIEQVEEQDLINENNVPDEEKEDDTKPHLPAFESSLEPIVKNLVAELEDADLLLARLEENGIRAYSEQKKVRTQRNENKDKLKIMQDAVIKEFEIQQMEKPRPINVQDFFPKQPRKQREERKERYCNYVAPKGYRITHRISKGGFGKIFSIRRKSDKVEYAMKVDSTNYEQVHKEAEVLKLLEGGERVPTIYNQGILEIDPYSISYAIIDLLGPSLEDCFQMRKKSFSLKTIRLLGEQMISAIAYVHSKDVTHRDIKPENWCIGRLSPEVDLKKVFLIDFGLATMPDRKEKPDVKSNSGDLIGTERWISKMVHEGWPPSWRDDFESLAYVLLYLNRGSMPWYGISTSAKIPMVRKAKLRRLIWERKCIVEDFFPNISLIKIIMHCRSLALNQQVCILTIMQALDEFCPHSIGFENDGMYDWDKPWKPVSNKPKKSSNSTIHNGKRAFILSQLNDMRFIRYEEDSFEKIVPAEECDDEEDSA